MLGFYLWVGGCEDEIGGMGKDRKVGFGDRMMMCKKTGGFWSGVSTWEGSTAERLHKKWNIFNDVNF